MKKLIVWTGLVALVLGLTACNTKIIKPEDKHIEAMYQFDMPDYEATPENVARKTQAWLESRDDVTFLYTKDGVVDGSGEVTVQTHGDDLITKFDLLFKVINGHQVEMNVLNFQDQESPRKGYSDRAFVFYNQVKDKVLDLGDEYLDYMESDTKPESSLEN